MNEFLRKFNIYQRRSLKYDFVSSIVVFLVAIPLCLGIAMASGAPLFAGLLSGIIGGIVVGIFSESHVSVSGPAAGMVVIVLGAISQLGDFETFLLAVMFAGLIQIAVGALRIGFIAEYVPSNVIQGLLSAIGILLIVKQLPLAFTHASDFSELSLQLNDTTGALSYGPLRHALSHLNTGAITITLLSLLTLIFFDKTKNTKLKAVPAPILVVLLGIVLNETSSYFGWYLTQDSPELVNIPLTPGLESIVMQLEAPKWSAVFNGQVYVYAAIIAAVASLESLLNLKASEKIDKKKRRCSKDRELIAQGIGNTVSGLMGGLPITSVVVRSSVNSQAGAKTKASTIFHGLFILFAVMLLPHWLNKIPLASLAAILLHVGYKLTRPSIYRDIYAQGWERFLSFIVTLISIVVLNLLVGILIGLAVSVFFILKNNGQERLDIIKENYPHGEISRLMLPQYATFLNKASLLAELDTIPAKTQLIIDARYSRFIDKEIMELVEEFKDEQAPQKKIAINLIGFKDHYEVHDHIDFIQVTTYDTQTSLSASRVLQVLKEGNQRFLNDNRIHRAVKTEVQHTSTAQHPIAVVLGCIDSRVPIETIFDTGFGDVFCIRVAGNIVNDDVLASMEYACNVVGAKLIVVLGHTHCGAIKAACDSVEQGLITQLLAKINPAVAAATAASEHSFAQVTEYNVANTLNCIIQGSDALRQLIETKRVGVAGALYDVESGAVTFGDYSSKMRALDSSMQAVSELMLKE